MRWRYPSLFCWLISLSSGVEPLQVRDQCVQGRGIFACDEWAVFSDCALELCGGLRGTDIGDLRSPVASWGSYANTAVFFKAYHSLHQSGKWRGHDWIVKVDPDTVFIPERLAQFVCVI